MKRRSRQSVWTLLADTLVFLAAEQLGVCVEIPGLAQVFDPTVVIGTTTYVPGPPSAARDKDTTHNAITGPCGVQGFMESRMTADNTYQTCRQNWPTTQAAQRHSGPDRRGGATELQQPGH